MILHRRSASASIKSAEHSPSIDTSSYSTELMVHLDIPSHLADRSQRSLRHSYAKYKAFLAAIPILEKKWKDRELPYERKPTQEQVIETMQSKTFWYDYIRKYFPRVSAYPEMVAWLEDAEDALSDVEVWKVEKGLYGFADLDMWLKNDGQGLELDELKRKKGQKEKERSPTKEMTGKVSHKGKEKEKDKEKRKGKDKGKGKGKEKSSQKEK
jgi:hypothetical protein